MHQQRQKGCQIIKSRDDSIIYSSWYGMAWHGVVWYGMVWYGIGRVWYGMAWHIWYGMVWYGMAHTQKLAKLFFSTASSLQTLHSPLAHHHFYRPLQSSPEFMPYKACYIISQLIFSKSITLLVIPENQPIRYGIGNGIWQGIGNDIWYGIGNGIQYGMVKSMALLPLHCQHVSIYIYTHFFFSYFQPEKIAFVQTLILVFLFLSNCHHNLMYMGELLIQDGFELLVFILNLICI